MIICIKKPASPPGTQPNSNLCSGADWLPSCLCNVMLLLILAYAIGTNCSYFAYAIGINCSYFAYAIGIICSYFAYAIGIIYPYFAYAIGK